MGVAVDFPRLGVVQDLDGIVMRAMDRRGRAEGRLPRHWPLRPGREGAVELAASNRRRPLESVRERGRTHSRYRTGAHPNRPCRATRLLGRTTRSPVCVPQRAFEHFDPRNRSTAEAARLRLSVPSGNLLPPRWGWMLRGQSTPTARSGVALQVLPRASPTASRI